MQSKKQRQKAWSDLDKRDKSRVSDRDKIRDNDKDRAARDRCEGR